MGRYIFPVLRTGHSFISKRHFNIKSNKGPTKEEVARLQQDLFSKLNRENPRLPPEHAIPSINNKAVKERRSNLFTLEKEKQLNDIGRIKKIEVHYEGPTEEHESGSLLMNQGISTPYDCARHLRDDIMESSVVAEVNGELWDMHKPLRENCKLKLLNLKLKDEDLFQINKIFWRSCSFMLGYVAESAFKDHIYIELHSFPSANVRSGSFVNDVDLKIPNWKPNSDELRVFSAGMLKLSRAKFPFERLEVSREKALEMFVDNKYKMEQIPEIAEMSDNRVPLYRIGDFIDISRGPLMSHTGILGKCTVTALHPMPQCNGISETLYRFQGVALPTGFLLNHFAYNIIEERGKKLNPAILPGTHYEPTSSFEENKKALMG